MLLPGSGFASYYKFKQVDYESLKNNVNLNIFSLQGPELSHVGDRARVWQLRRKVGKHFVKFIQHLIKSKQYAWEKVPSCLWQNIIEFKWFPQKSENLTFEILSFDGYNNRTIITLDFMKYYPSIRWIWNQDGAWCIKQVQNNYVEHLYKTWRHFVCSAKTDITTRLGKLGRAVGF